MPAVVVVGVEGFIPQGIVGLTVKLVGPRLRAHRNHCLAVAVLRAEVVGNDADFLQTLCVRQDRRLVIAAAHHRKTVQLNVVRKRAAAVNTDGGELGAAGNTDAEGIQRGAG